MRAMGLAGTQAAGLKSAFGTMAKPLHAGRAAADGFLSMLLARAGFTSAPGVVEAKQGFAATHAGERPDAAVIERLAGRFLVRETLFKYHAACYLTHAAIEAARALRDEHAIDPQAIDSAEVRVAPLVLGVCNIAEPATGLEGKFSLRATTALALLGADTGALATYSDAKMREPAVVGLRDRVRIVVDETLRPTRSRVTLTVDGRRLDGEADTGVPASDLADQRRRLRAKFDGLAAPVVGQARAATLAEKALAIESLGKVAELLALTRRSDGESP
jgi:2-methylcitrate dehydratase PrpD